ncbi:MAG: aminopeptidase N [Proteobacteria bacterium]|nr:aminopeptidase N [Pseudomonadota bacterium]
MPDTSSQPETIYLKDYTPPNYLIKTVDLIVELGEEVTKISSHLKLEKNTATYSDLSLNGEKLDLVSVALDGQVLSESDFQCTDDTLRIAVPDGTTSFSLDIVTEIKPQENTELEGLYKSSGNFCTQCEAEGFRKITYFLDRPDVMAVFSTTIIGDGSLYPMMLSNGNLVEQETLDDGRQKVVWQDPHPKPAYLFALVAGDLACVEDHFETRSGRDVLLRIFVEKGNENRCGHAMESLKKSMKWDEELFGREYDLDIFMIVAVSDFNMGAMENKGLNVFNSKYVLASPETATDADFDGIESVIAHEYFHNWTGNRITCRDWFQLTLKEGLTVFRDQQFSADMNSAAVHRISDVQRLRAAQFPEDAGPLAHPIQPQSYVEINNFYTATVYEKGAEVIRMIHTLLGKESFRKGMDVYFERHDGQAVTTEEFVSAMEAGSGMDLAQFRQWYLQPGTPEITVEEGYDPAKEKYSLTLEQVNPKAEEKAQALHIPVLTSLLDNNGKAFNLAGGIDEKVLELKERKQTFTFENIKEKPTASLFRNFSAPVKIKQKGDRDKLSFLFAKDTDLFNRWEAGQRLATEILLEEVKTFKHEVNDPLPDMFLNAYEKLLDDVDIDRSFQALAMSLPSEQGLAQAMDIVDVDAIHKVRDAAIKQLGTQFEEKLHSLYTECSSTSAAPSNQSASSLRKLKNTTLRYLAATEKTNYQELTLEQYHSASNMTDTVASLSILGDMANADRKAVFTDFFTKWEKDALVIDKWFTLQAMASHPDVLDEVVALKSHPAFTLYNPNRVRSLIGAFAAGNAVHFHEKSGRGYEFLSNSIQELNTINPQIAARLVVPLGQWRRYDTGRQDLMKAKLEKILDFPDLSNDVYEMANKSLHN